jgi:hypothetical protein
VWIIASLSAIERCRTAALGGHIARCENDTCAHTIIGYHFQLAEAQMAAIGITPSSTVVAEDVRNLEAPGSVVAICPGRRQVWDRPASVRSSYRAHT